MLVKPDRGMAIGGLPLVVAPARPAAITPRRAVFTSRVDCVRVGDSRMARNDICIPMGRSCRKLVCHSMAFRKSKEAASSAAFLPTMLKRYQ